MNSYYFSHDYSARSDFKIKKLLQKHGILGYGVFWAIVEELYLNANALPTDYDSIAYELRIDVSIIKSIINDFELFEIAGDYFGSLSVQRRIDEREKKSENARKSARIRWGNKEKNAIAMPTHNEGNAIKYIKEIKEDKYTSTFETQKSELPDLKKEDTDIQPGGAIAAEVYPTFDDFWELYDYKKGRHNAERVWKKLKQKDKEACISAVPSYTRSTPDKQYRKHPATYLNGKGWEDEINNNQKTDKHEFQKFAAGIIAKTNERERNREERERVAKQQRIS